MARGYLASAVLCRAARTDQHEARRRETYARQVLDAFGKELEGFTNFTKAAMKRFRSAVLTPILQRQLYGVPEAYTPSVRRAVMRDHSELTIKAATELYLGDDPTDPENIPNYHQNLLYAQEARWHLGRVMQTHINDAEVHVHVEYYNRFLEDHDRIMVGVKDGHEGYHESGCPYLTQAERSAIAREQLSLSFREELAMQVRHALHTLYFRLREIFVERRLLLRHWSDQNMPGGTEKSCGICSAAISGVTLHGIGFVFVTKHASNLIPVF